MLTSPARLIALIVAATLVATTGFIAAGLHPIYTSLPLLLLCFTLVVTSLMTMFWAANSLRDDVGNERWPEATIAPFRRVTTHILWNTATGLLLLAMLAALILNHRHLTWFWPIFVLLQTQTQLTTAFARPYKPTRGGLGVDWSTSAPIHSERWGRP